MPSKDSTIEVEVKENRYNSVWCYLALKLDATTLMTIRHDCVKTDGTRDDEVAWKCVLDRFSNNEASTVVSNVS